MTAQQVEVAEEYTLYCRHCGGADAVVSSVTGPHIRKLEDGVICIAMVSIRCSQCGHLTCYSIADTGGVIKVLAPDRMKP